MPTLQLSSSRPVLRLVAGAGTVAVVGVVILASGWVGIHDQDIFAAQIPWLVSGGFFGVCLIAFSGVLASTALRRGRVAQELSELDEAVELVRHLQVDAAAIRARVRR